MTWLSVWSVQMTAWAQPGHSQAMASLPETSSIHGHTSQLRHQRGRFPLPPFATKPWEIQTHCWASYQGLGLGSSALGTAPSPPVPKEPHRCQRVPTGAKGNPTGAKGNPTGAKGDPTGAKGDPTSRALAQVLAARATPARGQAVPTQPSLGTAGRLRGMRKRASNKVERNRFWGVCVCGNEHRQLSSAAGRGAGSTCPR